MKRVFLVAILSGLATFAFAEEGAPVFDADNYPPQFDGQPDSGSVGDDSSQAAAPAAPRLSMEQRVLRAEQQINNLQKTDAGSKMNALQGEVQTLRGQVEQLTHQLQQVQTQQRTMFADVDKRLSSKPQMAAATPADDATIAPAPAEPAPIVAPAPAKIKPKPTAIKLAAAEDKTLPVKATPASDTAKPVAQPNVAEEQQIYQTAYDLIKAKKYNEAIVALQKMLQKYPSGQFAANAHYWLGELFGLLGKNTQSATEFGNVVKNYPDSPKVSDAQLKLGLIYAAEFKWSDAKTAFKKVINRYPGTASARLAAEQLKQIKNAGH